MQRLVCLIALRYTFAKTQHTSSFSTWVSILGIGLGLFLIVTSLSVMNGFRAHFEKDILGSFPHYSIALKANVDRQHLDSFAQSIAAIQGVSGVQFNRSLGLVVVSNSGSGSLVQSIAKGVQLNYLDQELADGLVWGKSYAIEDKFTIGLSQQMLTELGLNIGDKLTVLLPELQVGMAGLKPKFKRLKVGFSYSVKGKDNPIYMSVDTFDALFATPELRMLSVKLADPYAIKVFDEASKDVMAASGDIIIFTRSWQESQASIFSLMELEKRMVGLILFCVVIISVFNAKSSLITSVNQRTRYIGILRTLGLTNANIMQVFMLQGILISVIGSFIGLAMILLVTPNIGDILQSAEKVLQISLMPAEKFGLTVLPSKIIIKECVVIFISGFILGTLSGVYPAYQAAKIEPSEALNYE